MGGSHGMGGGKAVAPQTREQQLLAQIRSDPTALMRMSDQDALDTVRAIEKQDIAHDGTQNDTFVQRYLNATGLANELPTVLDEEAFEKARKKEGAQTLYHSDEPSGGGGLASAHKTQQQLQTGKNAFASRGVMGSGTYLDMDCVGNAVAYGKGGTQVKMFLNKNAKMIMPHEVTKAREAFQKKHPKTYQYLLDLGTPQKSAKSLGKHGVYNLDTIWATASGYNACNRPGGYKVAYSRRALTICRKIVVAGKVNTDW